MSTYRPNLSGRAITLWQLIFITAPALAQNVATITDSTTMATNTSPTKPLGSNSISPMTVNANFTPTPSDDAPSGNNNNSMSSTGLYNYYFVFLALIVCVIGAVVFIVMRRRNMAMRRRRFGGEQALQQDVGGSRGGGGWSNWNPERGTRGRYWQGRWRSAEASREEGLNEHGEAPPPYIPKRRSEEGQHEGEEHGPAVPLQTLSRGDAGLKPPDYSETHTENADLHARHSSASAASASSSRVPEHNASP